MRLHKGYQLGSLLFSHDAYNQDNPIKIMDVHSQDEWPFDYEDAAEIIKIMRRFIREGKSYGKD